MVHYSKLVPPTVAINLPPLRSTDGQGDEAVSPVKLFDPCSQWTWYLTELDRATGEAFGLVVGQEVELGYFDLNELAGLKNSLGLPIERDLYWTAQPLRAVRERL